MVVVISFAAILLSSSMSAVAGDDLVKIPTWAKQGNFRFLRLDGGPAAAEKARLSGWPMSEAQLDSLEHLYTEHREKVLGLLTEAHINWVWLTWTTGFSWETEAEQRRQCAEMMAACQARGIHVAAYMTGNNMFWREMYKNEEGSKGWLRLKDGKPVLYFGQKERYLAQMDHPGWIALQKRRLKSAVEAGAEAFFYDNCDAWRSGEKPVTRMSAILRQYAHRELGSQALMQFNFMPHRIPPYIKHANLLDWSFCEGSTPPTVENGRWIVANPAHPAKFTASIMGDRPVIYETCTIPGLNRFESGKLNMSPRDITLQVAEAAAFDSSQSFYVESGFIHRLVTGEAKALQSWRAIGRSYDLLEKLSPVSEQVDQPANLLVVGDTAPDADPSDDIEAGKGMFRYSGMASVLTPLLQRSIPFDFCDIRALDRQNLKKYDTILLASVPRPPKAELDILRRFSSKGELLVMDSSPELHSVGKKFIADESGFAGLSKNALYQLKIDGEAPYVLGNLLEGGGEHLLQVVNYSADPAKNLTIKLTLADKKLPKRTVVKWYSPDHGTSAKPKIKIDPNGVVLKIDRLDVWGVLHLSEPGK